MLFNRSLRVAIRLFTFTHPESLVLVSLSGAVLGEKFPVASYQYRIPTTSKRFRFVRGTRRLQRGPGESAESETNQRQTSQGRLDRT